MKRKVLIFLIGIIFAGTAFAQNDNLVVQGITPNLYVLHTVQAKETWYSISRLYNINPKEMASSNGSTIDKPLAIGQQLKVPLTHANFSQDGNKAADEVFVPVHHVIQEKEWMYRISMNYNKVPIESLEKWNGINKDQAKAGLKIVVGYLKVKTAQSALAAKGTSKIAIRPPIPVTVIPTPEENKQVVKEDTKPAATEKVEPVVAKNDPPKEEPKTVTTATTPPLDNNGGYFKTQYGENGKSLAGSAGIFKSTSGWSDGKYYALMNNVAVGTILKVNNPSTGKAVYAKVLGNLPDMKESAGLTIRISDAAATELGAFNAAKFPVDVKY